MLTDFKFWYIKRDDKGKILEAAIRFYEGEITTALEDGIEVTRYRRTAKLDPKTEAHINEKRAFRKDANGNDVALYYPSDFGEITTEDELAVFLKGELAKDVKREPVETLKITRDA